MLSARSSAGWSSLLSPAVAPRLAPPPRSSRCVNTSRAYRGGGDSPGDAGRSGGNVPTLAAQSCSAACRHAAVYSYPACGVPYSCHCRAPPARTSAHMTTRSRLPASCSMPCQMRPGTRASARWHSSRTKPNFASSDAPAHTCPCARRGPRHRRLARPPPGRPWRRGRGHLPVPVVSRTGEFVHQKPERAVHVEDAAAGVTCVADGQLVAAARAGDAHHRGDGLGERVARVDRQAVTRHLRRRPPRGAELDDARRRPWVHAAAATDRKAGAQDEQRHVGIKRPAAQLAHARHVALPVGVDGVGQDAARLEAKVDVAHGLARLVVFAQAEERPQPVPHLEGRRRVGGLEWQAARPPRSPRAGTG